MVNEGKRRFADPFLHTDFNFTSFRDFHTSYETLFKVDGDCTVERINLYNTIFKVEHDFFSHFMLDSVLKSHYVASPMLRSVRHLQTSSLDEFDILMSSNNLLKPRQI